MTAGVISGNSLFFQRPAICNHGSAAVVGSTCSSGCSLLKCGHLDVNSLTSGALFSFPATWQTGLMCEQVQKLQIKKLGKVGNKSSADGWPPQKRGLPGDQPGGRTDLLLLCSLFGCLLGSSFNSITECDAALSSPQASSFGGRSSAEWSILNRSSEGTSGLVNRGNLESNVRLGTKNNTKSSGSQHFIPPPTKLQFFFHSETVNHVLSFPSTFNFIFFFAGADANGSLCSSSVFLFFSQLCIPFSSPLFSFFWFFAENKYSILWMWILQRDSFIREIFLYAQREVSLWISLRD